MTHDLLPATPADLLEGTGAAILLGLLALRRITVFPSFVEALEATAVAGLTVC